MDDPRWLRLVTIGLVLAALAVGYFLLTGRISSPARTQSQISKASSSPSPSPLPTQTPSSAYERIANRTQNQTRTLPATGFPLSLAVVFSLSAVISGFGLRKFPN